MQPLGVGLVYWPVLRPLFVAGEAAVLELEPQSLWTKVRGPSGWSYRLNERGLESIAELPQLKVLHGVGQPIGGSVDDPLDYLPLLRQMSDRLRPAWVSEHLAHNRVHREGRTSECGYLLPPLQRPAGVRVAAANIRRYAQALDRPVAFETGVNYLCPQVDDMQDGAFFGAVAEEADCGILLDLHNLWCNERNGRQSVADALTQMPLDRIWEVHFAGGSSLHGYCLDAHDGAIPPQLLEIGEQILQKLENVGALIFEILPEHLNKLGIDGVQRELEALRALWQTRPTRAIRVSAPARSSAASICLTDLTEVKARELAIAKALEGGQGEPPVSDPGYNLIMHLIRDVRSANLTRALKYTITALIVATGMNSTRSLINEYFAADPPDGFAAVEAHRFAVFLQARSELMSSVPYLSEVLAFEKALVDATLFGEPAELHWSIDPTLLLGELEAGRLPTGLPPSPSRMSVAT
jgi:uncharacterized protein